MPNPVKRDGYRTVHEDISGALDLTAAAVSQTLVAARASRTIYINRIVVTIKTDAAQSWTFEDSAGSPVYVGKITTSPGADSRWEFYYGEEGKPLTEGKAFNLTISAAGIAAHVEWVGYRKLTSTIDAATFASS